MNHLFSKQIRTAVVVGITGMTCAAAYSPAAAAAAEDAIVPSTTQPAAGGGDTMSEMADEIRSLRARVQQLESDREQTAVTTQHAGESAGRTSAAVIEDADHRSAMFDMEGFTAGYTSNKGFVVRSGDGDFLLHPWLQFAFRGITNDRQDSKPDGDDDVQNGFELRRMKLGFDGNLWGPSFKYTFIWATDRKTGTLGIEEASFVYKIGDLGSSPEPISVQAGQFKNYFAHESMASSKRVFAVERTLLNDVFTGGDNFIQGVGLIYNEGNNGGPLQIGVVVNDGSNDFSAAPSGTSRNFQDYPVNKWDFGAAARVQYKFFGNWKDYEDFTATTLTGPDLLVAGAAVDYSEAGDFDQVMMTADVQYKTGPIALYGAYLVRNLRNGGVGGAGGVNPSPATAGTGNFYDYGFLGKAGYALSKRWEVFAQYSYIQFDSGEFAAGTESSTHEITCGVNYYLKGHSAKLTFDATWLPDGTPVANDGGGILAQPNSENEFVVRGQFQLLL
jgi:outer membrane murein-binding lipoprotein Lpp